MDKFGCGAVIVEVIDDLDAISADVRTDDTFIEGVFATRVELFVGVDP